MSVTAARLQKQTEDLEELIASHGNQRSLDDFAVYFDRPVEFFREVLKWNPWDKQIEVAEAVVRDPQTAVKGFHGAGKDAVMAALMLWAAYCRGMLVLAISATEQQLLAQLWREVTDLFNSAGDALPGQLFSQDLRINGQRRIVARTSGSVSNLTGYHDKHGVFVCISESQSEQTEAAAFDAAIANTTDAGSRILVVGNPVKNAGRFRELFYKPTWRKITVAAADHPNVKEGRLVVGSLKPTFPEDTAAEYGIDSAFYQSRVLAEFPTDDITQLIKRAWIDAAFDRHDVAVNDPNFEQTGRRRIIADLAGPGVDRTCVGTRRGDVLHFLEYWNETDTMELARRLANLSREYGRADSARAREHPAVQDKAKASLTVDVGGLGLPIADRLSELGVSPHRFNGANRARKSDKFANMRAESYFKLRDELQRDRLALPRSETLAEELLAHSFGLDGSGRILIVAKKDVKADIGRSPDQSDVCAMSCDTAPVFVQSWWPF